MQLDVVDIQCGTAIQEERIEFVSTVFSDVVRC